MARSRCSDDCACLPPGIDQEDAGRSGIPHHAADEVGRPVVITDGGRPVKGMTTTCSTVKLCSSVPNSGASYGLCLPGGRIIHLRSTGIFDSCAN